jgi:folate-binding protein YgfZ
MRVVAQDEQVVSGTAQVGDEFRALISGCGVYRLERALVSLTGEDRVRWLNGMVTNNVRDLAVGQGIYTFLLNPQGKIQADLYAFNRSESLLVEAERGQVETILQIFDRYIIMDDVEVENLTGKFQVIGVAGPKAEGVLAAAGLQVGGLQALQIVDADWNGAKLTVIRGDNPCVTNYELLVRDEDAKPLSKALLQAGAQEVHEQALESFRIACGIPKFGVDIRQRDLPQETGQDRALNFSKGCYIGQEIVERIRSRGAVHRVFTGFEVEGMNPAPGFRIQDDGKDIAELTSVVTLPASNRTLALGYGRREFMMPGKEFAAGDSRLRVAALPFSGVFES